MSRYSLLLSALAASQVPSQVLGGVIPRDDPPIDSKSIQDLAQTAISIFLGSQNVADKGFYALTGWKTVDWVGQNSAVDNSTGNLILFQTADALPERSGEEHSGQLYFSDNYVHFIQEANKALASNDTNISDELKAAQDKQVKACFTDIQPILNEALTAYVSSTGITPSNKSDSAFISWASTGFTPYTTANTECQDSTNDYFALLDKLKGDDFAIFSAASNNVRGLTTSPPASHPGINMPIDKALPGAPSTVQGNYVPAYAIPVLPGTLGGWQSAGNTQPSYAYDSKKDTFKNDSSTSFGGGHLGFVWDEYDVSGNGQGEHKSSSTVVNTTAQTFSLSFNGLALMDVERGVWFDGFRSANALNKPVDDTAKKGKAVFDKFFQTADNPGPVAVYNAKALVGFQPSWTIEFSSSEYYNKYRSDQGSAEVCALFICFGGSGGSTSNNTQFDNATNTVKFTDPSKNGYILGYVQHNFWEV
ncbi:hypothetical protein C8J57DRAFT_1116667 [Mycena rebaudengoi]|nr:hypothetical protein C8J57DRAFT_1116667 [Mycena rebaudengoi]